MERPPVCLDCEITTKQEGVQLLLKPFSELQQVQEDYVYLTDISTKDKPWDIHGAIASLIRDLYGDYRLTKRDGSASKPFAERIGGCSQVLGFGRYIAPETGEVSLRLKTAQFCRCRHCPKCAWRRVLKFLAKLYHAIPKLHKDYPTARFVFLTLTVPNPPMGELRDTIRHMNKAWHKLTQRKQWPAIGWVKCLEVTRGKDGNPHPHFHCLLVVKPGYFSRDYLNQADWTELWKSCLRVNYTPIVHIRVTRTKQKPLSEDSESSFNPVENLRAAIQENLKVVFTYMNKSECSRDSKGEYQADWMVADTEEDRQWLLAVTQELSHVRAIAVGGVMKDYLAEWEEDLNDPDNLVNIDEAGELNPHDEDVLIPFVWGESIKRYRLKNKVLTQNQA